MTANAATASGNAADARPETGTASPRPRRRDLRVHGSGASARTRGRKKTGPARFSIVGAIGELLLIAGLIMGLFVGWKLWWQPQVLGAEQARSAVEVARVLAERTPGEPATLDASGIAIRKLPAEKGVQFGVLYIPALGQGWMRPLTTSVAPGFLKDNIGHYPSTKAPGEVGNFAIAGHRTGYGDPFVDLPSLPLGAHIYVETVDGWYDYEYRSGTYVPPQAVGILDDVPMAKNTPANGDRIITMQTCNPPHRGGPELFVGYGSLVRFTARAQGAPAEVTAVLRTNQATQAEKGNGA